VKIYEGRRTMDGIVVTVDGTPLEEHKDVKSFTPYGFEWAYEGGEPHQLAFAILYDHLGDKERAVILSDKFMRDIVANLDNDWALTSEEIDAAIGKTEPA
jgi:hypothetical protein